MSEGIFTDRKIPVGLILAGFLVLGTFAFTASAGATGVTCSPPLNPCPIFFDSIQTSGNAGTGLFASTMTLLLNVTFVSDFMVVTVGANGNLNAISVTDTQLNSFAHPLTGINGNIGATLDVFTTFPKAAGLDTITVTFADGGPPDAVINVGFYRNVEGTGRTATLNTSVAVTTLSMPFNTTRSGSLVLGFTELNPNTNPGITASPGFIQRTDQPPLTGSTEELDFQEANRTYTANTVITFNPSWTALGATQGLLGAIELTPTFHQGFAFPECLTLGETCHFNFANKASGTTNGNQLVHSGTIYCTGITTFSLTTITTSTLEIAGTYSLESRNVTGALYTVRAVIGLTPSTIFGTGDCGSATSTNVLNLYTPLSGTAGTKAFSASFVFDVGGVAPGTYFGWVSIVPQQNTAINNLGANGSLNVPGSSLGLKQVK